MPDELDRLGEFSELGRGVPLALTRPGPALPFSPLVRQAYAPNPRARLGWGQGTVTVGDLAIEFWRERWPCPLPSSEASPAEAAGLLSRLGLGFVPVIDGGPSGRMVGVVFAETLLDRMGAGTLPDGIGPLVTEQIPTCRVDSLAMDAVRQLLACFLLRLPVVDEQDRPLGLFSLAEAAAAQDRDPAIRDLLEGAIGSPSLFARAWR
jgi:hypothetical protein